MATRVGKQNPVESKACAFVAGMKIVRMCGQAKSVAGKLTRRGDS